MGFLEPSSLQAELVPVGVLESCVKESEGGSYGCRYR
jgi:hypothetical protein